MNRSSGFTADGEERFRDALYQQARREFAQELAAATEYWARVEVEKKIEAEVKRRMKELAPPQSLW